MDPLRFAIAASPLAAYLILLGLVNLRRRPLLVTGGGDLATLGVALTGVAFVGPIALFRPDEATVELGDFVWLFLLAFYWLWLTLFVMVCRPRLVVYNVTAEELRPVLSQAARQVDPTCRWAGPSLTLPGVGVEAHLDSFAWLRNTSLVASGGQQDLAGWRRLTKTLERSLREAETRPNRRGPVLLTAGGGLLLAVVLRMAASPEAVAIAMRQLFAFGAA